MRQRKRSFLGSQVASRRCCARNDPRVPSKVCSPTRLPRPPVAAGPPMWSDRKINPGSRWEFLSGNPSPWRMGAVGPPVLLSILFSMTPFPGPPPVRIVRHCNFWVRLLVSLPSVSSKWLPLKILWWTRRTMRLPRRTMTSELSFFPWLLPKQRRLRTDMLCPLRW